jgi:lipoprotein NlpI/Zn-dependent protease
MMGTLALSAGVAVVLLAVLGASLPRLYARGVSAAARRLDVGDFDEAIHLATRALGIGRFTPVSAEQAHFVRGVAGTLSGRYDLARTEFDAVIRLKPDWTEAYVRRGDLFTARRQLDDAIADYQVALELDPATVEAHIGRGRACCLQRRYDEALIDCAAVIRLRPDDARAQWDSGILQFCAGRFGDAADSFSRCARLDPNNAYAVLWLHLARARAGEDDAAEYRAHAARLDRRSWPGPLVALELGEASLAEVLAAAAADDDRVQSAQLCEAAFYRGQQALLRGMRDEAQGLLAEAQRSNARHCVEAIAAEVELSRIAPGAAPEASAPSAEAPPAPRPVSRGSVPSVPLSPGAFRPSARGIGAWLTAAGVIGLKLIKSAKFVKFGLFVLSLGALAIDRPFAAACAIVYAIFVHESGHVLAMKASGMRTSGMYFLPFLGAVAVGREPARTRGQEWFIAIAGPAFGLLSILPLLAVGWVTGERQWSLYATFAALINLFNLLPIGVLDGGRIVQAIAFSIAGWVGIAVFALGLVGGAYVVWRAAGGVLSIILLLSILEFTAAWRRNRTNPIPPMRWPAVIGATLAYLGLLIVFAFAFETLGAMARGLVG